MLVIVHCDQHVVLDVKVHIHQLRIHTYISSDCALPVILQLTNLTTTIYVVCKQCVRISTLCNYLVLNIWSIANIAWQNSAFCVCHARYIEGCDIVSSTICL